MLRFIFGYLLLLIVSSAFGQESGAYYGIQCDDENTWFVKKNIFSYNDKKVSEVSENPDFVVGSSTFDANNAHYIFRGYPKEADTICKLFTIDIRNGEIVYAPVCPSSTGSFEYDNKTNKLYGIWIESALSRFVTVDLETGERNFMFTVPQSKGVFVGGNTFSSDSGYYFFLSIPTPPGPTIQLYTIDVNDSSLKYSVPNPANTDNYEYDEKTGKLYGLWTEGNTVRLVDVDYRTGTRNVIAIISDDLNVVQETSTFNSDSGHYFFIGESQTSFLEFFYVIDVIDGTIIKKSFSSNINYEYSSQSFTVSLNGENSYSDIKVYPNPVQNSDEITIEGEFEEVILYNANGERINQLLTDDLGEEIKLYLPELPPGVYIILLKNSSLINTQKLIIL